MRRQGSKVAWLAWFGALILGSAGGYAATVLRDHSLLTLAYGVCGLVLGTALLYQNSRSRWTSWGAVGAFLGGFVLTRTLL